MKSSAGGRGAGDERIASSGSVVMLSGRIGMLGVGHVNVAALVSPSSRPKDVGMLELSNKPDESAKARRHKTSSSCPWSMLGE